MSEPTLLLLHGLGATRGVWHGLVAELDWPGRVLAPNLRGHASAPWTGDYTVGGLAAGVSELCEPNEPVIVVGHSLGGGVGLCLASGFFRPEVLGVVGLGIKVAWSDDDVAGMARVAAKGERWVDSRQEAVALFLRFSGLGDLIGDDHPAIEDAVVEDPGTNRWRVAQDPMTFAQQRLDMAGLVSTASCPVVLGAGSDDQIVAGSELAAFVADPRIAQGAGHNVHIERPKWVGDLVRMR